MKNYVITIDPSEELKSKILALKAQAKTISGPQTYLDSKPHLTLYAGTFENLENFKEELEQISKTISKPTINVEDWKVFNPDPVTQGATIVCKLAEEDISNLRTIQQKLVTLFNKYRAKEIPTRYQIQSEDEQIKSNLENFGFPFVGEIWEPHLTIASFQQKDFNNVWEELKDKCPKGQYSATNLSVYEVDWESDELTKIWSAELNT